MARQAQFSVNFLRNVIFYAAAHGVDLDALCRASGIEKQLLEQPDRMVDGPLVEGVWLAAIRMTGDENLALHLGEAAHPSSLGLLGFAMLSCPSLGQAIDKMARFWNLMSDATSIECHRHADRAHLDLIVIDLPGNFLMHSRHPAESSLSAALTIVKGLAGRPLQLLDVASTYPRPDRVSEFERIFGRTPRFSAEANRIVFPAEALDWPVLHSNPALLAAFETQIEARLRPSPQSIIGRLRQAIAKGLRGDLPDLNTVARTLHMSSRALQRELQNEGTTFRQVLDELRKDLALSYLAEAKHSIADVSFLLGYSEASVFHRSFRKWTGQTPAEYRASRESPASSTRPTRSGMQ